MRKWLVINEKEAFTRIIEANTARQAAANATFSVPSLLEVHVYALGDLIVAKQGWSTDEPVEALTRKREDEKR